MITRRFRIFLFLCVRTCFIFVCEQTFDVLEEAKLTVERIFLKLFNAQHEFKILTKFITNLTSTCFVVVCNAYYLGGLGVDRHWHSSGKI